MRILREGRAGLLLLSLSALSLLNAAAPLNPKVKVVKHPTTPVPSECEEGLAPQPAPRIDLAPVPEAPSPASMEAPPSASLRDLLRATQNAAAGHDRDAFNNSLARVKAILQSYPPGGERNVATDVVRVYDDLSRVWTYEFDTPNGAFLDSSNDLLRMMNAYPRYSNAVEEQTLTVGPTKLYPSRESRDFLLREAGVRLSKLGIGNAPAPLVATTPATQHNVNGEHDDNGNRRDRQRAAADHDHHRRTDANGNSRIIATCAHSAAAANLLRAQRHLADHPHRHRRRRPDRPLPRLVVTLDINPRETGFVRLDLREVFGNDHRVALEIGPGKGRFLIASAIEQPDTNFIGIEKSLHYYRVIRERAAKRNLTNVRLINHDAFLV